MFILSVAVQVSWCHPPFLLVQAGGTRPARSCVNMSTGVIAIAVDYLLCFFPVYIGRAGGIDKNKRSRDSQMRFPVRRRCHPSFKDRNAFYVSTQKLRLPPPPQEYRGECVCISRCMSCFGVGYEGRTNLPNAALPDNICTPLSISAEAGFRVSCERWVDMVVSCVRARAQNVIDETHPSISLPLSVLTAGVSLETWTCIYLVLPRVLHV